MGKDSSSTRRRKQDRSGNNSREEPNIRKGRSSPISASAKTGSASLRRSTRGTTSREQITSTSLASETTPEKESKPVHNNTRKSMRLEEKDIKPPVKRKSEVLEKEKTLSSPLRRSDRGKKLQSPASADSNSNRKITDSPNVNRKKLRKEKSVKQLTFEAMEASKMAQEEERSNDQIKKTLTRDAYKALFRKQQKRDTGTDFDNELKRPEKLSEDDINYFGIGPSNSVGDADDGVPECREKIEEECLERDCEGEKDQSIFKSNNANAYALNDHGALVSSSLNSKCSSGEALGHNWQENCVNASNESTVGEDVILLPWYASDLDKELERPEKLFEDDRSCFRSNVSNTAENGVGEYTGEIEKECDAFNENTIGEEVILLPWYATDSNKELARWEKLSQDDSFGDSLSNPMEDGDNGVEECSGELEEEYDEIDCEGGNEQFVSMLNNACVEPPQENDVKALNGSKIGEKIIDDSEWLQVDHALVVELPSPEVEILSDSHVVEGTGVLSCTSSKGHKDSFMGTCASCSKRRRLEYDSPMQELCSCSLGMNNDLLETSISQDIMELARCTNSFNHGDLSTCAICKLDGKLWCCDGKGCKKSYHLSCLDVPRDDDLPGAWHCFSCVKKKIEYGAHSVSVGAEAIWDAREVVNKGLQRQRQFLVKYKGLSHIHNHWVSETRLLLEAPMLVSEFDEQKQDSKWRQEWTVPHRLLKKRLLWSPKHHEKSHSDTSNCQYEWFVKWCGLDYEHATWELEIASFFHSSQVQSLMRAYENRRQRAKEAVSSSLKKSKKHSISKLPKLRPGYSSGDERNQLTFVNRLCEFWSKGQNAVVIDDQERIAIVMLFIASLLPDVTQPFLIISSPNALSIWESEFSRLAPFINVVVYSGSQDSRKIIRTSEFYADRRRIMLQVLLSSVESVIEDTKVLLPKWEAIIVDECQDCVISKHFEQIRMLRTSVRILLFNGQLKESTAQHLNVLSLLDSSMDMSTVSGLECSQLKEKLSPFIAYNCRADSSRFVEYWVPVSTSNVQLEQYCSTLLSNYTTLRSPSLKDIVGGALHDILISTKKCCDHPYIFDLGLQGFLTKDLPPVEYLDVGIKASGKLQLLDIILSEIKSQGKRVLILYQLSAGMLTGDILDDFLRQRFGSDSYQRVDKAVLPSKKQAALNKFNDKGRGEFVFLLEKHACSPRIKLTSVDVVVIFDSDWNLMNDNRAVQKLSFDSSPELIKIFRLYTCCTMEEKVLDLATNNTTLDSTLQNISSTTSHLLLMWGASYLFSKLDEFHGSNASNSGAKLCSDISMLQDVAGEFLNLLAQKAENSCESSLITKVQRTGSTYSKSAPLFGHSKVKSSDGRVPHLFWNELLESKNPPWRFLSGYSHRSRKRVQYVDALPENPVGRPDCLSKKQKKITSDSADAASPRTRHKEGGSGVISLKSPASLPFSSNNTLPEFDGSKALENRRKLRDVQKNLHGLLKSSILQLSEILHLPETVKTMGEKFLEYIVKNHQIHSEPSTILQAFQMSLVWIAASLLRYKLDKKNSLDVAKKFMGFHCTEEEVINVHSKLRILQKKFKDTSGKIKEFEPTKDNLVHALKKSKKRKIKLLQKHEEEIEEFIKIWEERKTEIENQHRIESVVVRTIHHHNQAVRLENLKRADEVFARKLDEHTREKELCLQDLREKQLNEITKEDKEADSLLKKITDSGQKERSIGLLERLVPSENELPNGQEKVGSISGVSQTPYRTEMAEDESLWSSTSGTILDGDATCCEHPANILEQAEIELLHPTNSVAMQADLCAASTHANEINNVTDRIEGGPTLVSPNSESTEHHTPHVEPPPSQQGEQSNMQSRENLVPPCSAHDATHHPSQHQQQNDLRRQRQPSLLDPLQMELDRLQKEKEEATKLHEDAKLQLKSEYEDEVKAVIAELHSKYETKLKGAEAEFLMKKEELDSHQNKVFMNRILAEAFRTKSQEFKPSASSGAREVPNFLQQLLSLSSQHRGTSSVSSNQQTAASPVPAPPRSSPTITNMQMRQPRTLPIRNVLGSELRAPAPHLRPSLSASAPATFSTAAHVPPGFSTPMPLRQPNVLLHAADLATNFVGLFGNRANGGVNLARSSSETDVVCLTDDE